METVNLKELHDRADQLRVQLTAVKEEKARSEEEFWELFQLLQDTKTIDFGAEFDKLNAHHERLRHALHEVKWGLANTIDLLSAQKIPLGDQTWGLQMEGEEFWHRHLGRYKFIYPWRDGKFSETPESEPRCERIFADGRVEPNLSCKWVGLDGDNGLLADLAKKEIQLEFANRELEEARSEWLTYVPKLRRLVNPGKSKCGPGSDGEQNATRQAFESFRQQLAGSGLSDDVIRQKLDELAAKLGLD